MKKENTGELWVVQQKVNDGLVESNKIVARILAKSSEIMVGMSVQLKHVTNVALVNSVAIVALAGAVIYLLYRK